MAIGPVIRFLQAARSMAKQGMKKEQILDFARREFGKVSELLKRQIDDIYSRYKKPKTQKKGEVVPIKEGEGIPAILTKKQKEELKDFIKKADEKQVEDLSSKILKKRTEDIAKGDPTGELQKAKKDFVDENFGDLLDELDKIDDRVKEIKKTAGEMEGISPFKDFESYVLGGTGLDPRKAMVRTAAREILNKNKIKIGREDPIEVLRKTYGEDALEAIDAIGDDLLNTQTYGEVDDLLTKNKLFDFKPKKVPGNEQNVVAAEKIRKAKEQEAKQKKILEDWDPPDRTENADGGLINILKL